MTTTLHSLPVMGLHLSVHQLWCESDIVYPSRPVENLCITFTLREPVVNTFNFSLDDTYGIPIYELPGHLPSLCPRMDIYGNPACQPAKFKKTSQSPVSQMSQQGKDGHKKRKRARGFLIFK